MIRSSLVALLLMLRASLGAAQALPEPLLSNTEAFERGVSVSLYQFDACGDPLAGRMFRRALAERFAQCPFSPEAQARFQQRTRAAQAKARAIMSQTIETNGGLPHQLENMPTTCRQQQASEDYQSFRRKLEQYAAGSLVVGSILPARCDSTNILP